MSILIFARYGIAETCGSVRMEIGSPGLEDNECNDRHQPTAPVLARDP